MTFVWGKPDAGAACRKGRYPLSELRLEDADYEGHSLAMLNRIASALDKRVEIRFVSRKPARVIR